MSDPVKLKFSEKYDREHAKQYFLKHQDGLARKLSHYRDEQMAREALYKAGEPGLVLDLPCGAGQGDSGHYSQKNRTVLSLGLIIRRR